MGEAVEVAAGFQFVEDGRDTGFGGGSAGGEIGQGQCVLGSGADQGPQDAAGLCAELGIVAGIDE